MEEERGRTFDEKRVDTTGMTETPRNSVSEGKEDSGQSYYDVVLKAVSAQPPSGMDVVGELVANLACELSRKVKFLIAENKHLRARNAELETQVVDLPQLREVEKAARRFVTDLTVRTQNTQ